MKEPYQQLKLILNPVSGAGRGWQRGQSLMRLLRQEGIGVETFITRRAKDAEQEASRTSIPVVVVGGDGTVNEVINGLKGRKIPMAVLPVGTANLLAREFHLSGRPESLFSLIQSGKTQLLDAGQLYGQARRRFLMVASIGLDAEVTRIMQQSRVGSIHLYTYLKPILRALKCYPLYPFSVIIDDRTVIHQVTTAVIGNVKNYGGFFSITHRARADDHLLDVCIFSGQSRLNYLRYLTGALLRRPSVFSDVGYYRGKKIEIYAPKPVPVELDGDFFGYTPFACRIVPESVELLLPD